MPRILCVLVIYPQQVDDVFVCYNVVDGREYHVRLCRVGARAAVDRGCVSRRKMWGRRSKGKFLEGSKRDSREVGRERAAKRTHEVTILVDSSLFETANYVILSLLLQKKTSWQFRLLSILHYLAILIFIKVVFCPLQRARRKLN